MKTTDILKNASNHLKDLSGHSFDVLRLSKPMSIENALNIYKIVSKLSPLVGNLIEFNIVDFLNKKNEFKELGSWKRQDPGFPDAVFQGSIQPTPGFEIKAWFPLATEITARFKDSQKHFRKNQTRVAVIAWLPENIIFGCPRIIGIQIVTGASVAKARDDHYHNPPDYLVLEPEDTTDRTSNLQQTNTNGFKFQGTPQEFEAAKKVVESWGKGENKYRPTRKYQATLRTLISGYKYRLDTNYAKMDRIAHPGIEKFKSRILDTTFKGMMIQEWIQLLSRGSEERIVQAFKGHLGIEDGPKGIENQIVKAVD
ncbi:MAG: hypothetical protein HQ568_03675 [Calditrichaeota bacterium]|nr:hypothetical protein [Calditrichota bacterium]